MPFVGQLYHKKNLSSSSTETANVLKDDKIVKYNPTSISEVFFTNITETLPD